MTSTSPPKMFDLALLRQRQARAAKAGAETFLLDRVVEDLSERLHAVVRDFRNAVDLGSPGHGVVDVLAASVKQSRHLDWSVSEHEALPLEANSLDLVVSALGLQFVNDLPGVLAQIRRALQPDGYFLAATVGGDTLTELRQSFAEAEVALDGGLSPRVIPMLDLRDAGALLQRAGFALPVTDVDRVTVRYDNMFGLMRDLRRMGATNMLADRRRTPLRRATLMRAAEVYAQRFSDFDGRIRATFDIVWMAGWSPHESQPKPLRPGSAKMSLEKAVRKAGARK
ncbi:methyltransferase domain-containing protein [[Pseudomonas] carboxydohydrogena]|uniref:Methyltransferase domain-containing protein n=1 Tax=Afipia carboxydohydrogena TaxID=290 RepID=A0ABY8BTE1_AFICR|nr:methyltransferase domain-containing protein [[Pseudomonas] carboxydohydrogena]WEF51930.1 methyltransferase domain-containing protein [[Pseudomonas] carboxydohydrogena]